MKIPSPNLFCSLQGSPYKGPHTDFLQSHGFFVAGKSLQRPAHRLSAKSHFRWCGHVKELRSFSEHSSKLLRAYAAHTRGNFLV